MAINAKKKGNLWENRWANWLSDNGIHAWKDGASGGGTREKSDVGNDIDYSFQVKGVKKLNLQEAWRQAKRDAELVQDIPCVVVHFDGMAEDDFLVVMSNHDWIEAIKNPKVEPVATPADLQSDRQMKWKLERFIQTGKDLLKEFS